MRYRYVVFCGGKFDRFEGKDKILRRLQHVDYDHLVKTTSDVLDQTQPNNPIIRSGDFEENSPPIIRVDEYSRECRRRSFCRAVRSSGKFLGPQDGVIIVSYFLPVKIKKDEANQWSVAWNEENLLSLKSILRISWVGSVQCWQALTVKDEEIITNLLHEMSCYPIFLKRDIHMKFYNILCKQIIWPVLHHHCDLYGRRGLKKLDSKQEQELWYIFTTVNQKISKKVVEIYQESSLIWIHGFHLMLLPSCIRRKIPQAKVGIFFHTPFPSSEIWKTLWCREDLLWGILAADQIGFHVFEYARHFLTTCRRTIGTHYEFDASGATTIQTGDRNVYINCLHVGINDQYILKEIHRQEFPPFVQICRTKYQGKIIVASKSSI